MHKFSVYIIGVLFHYLVLPFFILYKHFPDRYISRNFLRGTLRITKNVSLRKNCLSHTYLQVEFRVREAWTYWKHAYFQKGLVQYSNFFSNIFWEYLLKNDYWITSMSFSCAYYVQLQILIHNLFLTYQP
jgi:hypothetical protein